MKIKDEIQFNNELAKTKCVSEGGELTDLELNNVIIEGYFGTMIQKQDRDLVKY